MGKRVLVIGSGGREHAIVDALSRSPQVEKIYAAPGNAGIACQAECVAIKDSDVAALKEFALTNHIDLTVVGPEAALAVGVVDEFRQAGLPIFGHTKSATRIESSKEFAKELMKRHNIPTAAYQTFDDYDKARRYIETTGTPTVIKYDGLAAGKGVVVAMTFEEADAALKDMLMDESFGKGRVVIEEYLEGPEFSLMCFVNGSTLHPMPVAQDHKRAYDGDKGPNTGGMGAYTTLPFITEDDLQYAIDKIMQPTIDAMASEGYPLTGVLYGGLMKTATGIKVIEFNARFGDPETEVVLPLLDSDIFDIFAAIATNRTVEDIHWSKDATLGIVLASKGYPGSYEKGFVIDGLDKIDATAYHMGTARNGEGELITAGGRVMIIVARGTNLAEAMQKANTEVEKIKCENLFHRTDIGHKALK